VGIKGLLGPVSKAAKKKREEEERRRKTRPGVLVEELSRSFLLVLDPQILKVEKLVSGSDAGSYLRLIDLCITKLQA